MHLVLFPLSRAENTRIDRIVSIDELNTSIDTFSVFKMKKVLPIDKFVDVKMQLRTT